MTASQKVASTASSKAVKTAERMVVQLEVTRVEKKVEQMVEWKVLYWVAQ